LLVQVGGGVTVHGLIPSAVKVTGKLRRRFGKDAAKAT